MPSFMLDVHNLFISIISIKKSEDLKLYFKVKSNSFLNSQVSDLDTFPVTCNQLNKGFLMHVRKRSAQVKDQYRF